MAIRTYANSNKCSYINSNIILITITRLKCIMVYHNDISKNLLRLYTCVFVWQINVQRKRIENN